MVFVCLNSSSIILFLAYFFPFVPSLTSIEILEPSIFMVIWRIFSRKKMGIHSCFQQSSPGLCIHHLIVWSFDRLIIWSIWFIWSFDPFDPKIYVVSLFCLCIFFTYSFFLFFMFWFSEEEMEEVRDRFFFFIRSEDRRRQQNLGQNGFVFATKQFF